VTVPGGGDGAGRQRSSGRSLTNGLTF